MVSAFHNVGVCFLFLFYMIINWIYLGWRHFKNHHFGLLTAFPDRMRMINWLIVKLIGRLMDNKALLCVLDKVSVIKCVYWPHVVSLLSVSSSIISLMLVSKLLFFILSFSSKWFKPSRSANHSIDVSANLMKTLHCELLLFVGVGPD